MKKLLFTLAILWLVPRLLYAQLSGNYIIGPTQTYTSIASIISDLNAQGISGNVTISVPANYVETTPAGGFALGSTLLNASLNSSHTLQFVKSGVGANPLIYGAAGQYATTIQRGLSDVIWSISGSDYVSIDGIDLCDSTINTTLTTANEIGYGFFKLNATAPFDGCQHNRIQNCKIRLQNFTVVGNSNVMSIAIAVLNKTRAGGYINLAGQNAMNLSSANDGHSFNKIYSNVIVGSCCGISFSGSTSNISYWDTGNDIGGYSASTGNLIYDFGNNSGAFGINVDGGESNFNVSYNTINDTLSTSPSMASTFAVVVMGIYLSNVNNAGVTNGSAMRITHNNIAIGLGSTISLSNAVTYKGIMAGISHENLYVDTNNIVIKFPVSVHLGTYSSAIEYSGGNALNSSYIRHNTISGTIRCDNDFYGIIDWSVNFKSDNIIGNSFTANIAGMYNSYANFRVVRVLGGSTVANTLNIKHNVISNVNSLNQTNNLLLGFEINNPMTKIIHFDSNTISNINLTGISGAEFTYQKLDSLIVNGNNFTNWHGASMTGITDWPFSNTAKTIAVIHDNLLTDFIKNNLGFSIFPYKRQANTGSLYFFNNTIKNMIDTLMINTYEQYGMYFVGYQPDTFKRALIYNNVISMGNNTAGLSRQSNCSKDIAAIYLEQGKHNRFDIFNNTLSVFGVVKNINQTASVIRNKGNDTLYLKNNIFANYCDWDVTNPNGHIADIIIDSTASLLGASSNNNAYYVKELHRSKSCVMLINNNRLDSILAVQTALTPRESASFYEEQPFISVDNANAGFCQFNPAIMTQCESGGTANLPIALNTDILGNKRFGASGYSGQGTAKDIGAYETNCAPYVVPVQIINAQINPVLNSCSAIARTVTCSLTVAPGFSINTVQLNYSWNGSIQAPITMNNIGSSTWSGVLPAAVPASAFVKVYVEATTTNGNFVRSSVSSFQDAAFSSNKFKLSGGGVLSCGSAAAQLSLLNVGDSSLIIPTGYGISMPNANPYGGTPVDILNVTLTGNSSILNNTSSFSSTGGPASNGLVASQLGMYSNYTNSVPPVDLLAGGSYPFSFTFANSVQSIYNVGCLVYIDLNRNGYFDLPAENVYFMPIVLFNQNIIDTMTYNVTLNIPSTNVVPGKTLMRVICIETNVYSPVSIYNEGETEDYVVTLGTQASTNYAYSWTDNGTPIGTNSSALNYNGTQVGNHVIQANVSNGVCLSADTVHIKVQGFANATLTPFTVPNLCNGDSVTLTANYSGPPVFFSWLKNGSLIQNATGSTYNVHQPGDYTVWLSNGTCSDTSNHVHVNYYPSPATSYNSVISPNDSICRGQSVSILVNGLFGMNWTPNYSNGSIITPQQSTQYSVSGMDANNCYYQDHFSIHVDTYPRNIIIAGNPIININSPFYYAVNSVAGQTYQWLINGGSIVNGQGTNSIAVLWNSASPTYSLGVIVANASGCADTFNLALSFSNGLNELGSNGINLYPSPASSTITFSLSANSIGNKPYRIENVLGQVLLRGEYLGRETRVDVSSLTDGIYYLKLDRYSMPFVVGR